MVPLERFELPIPKALVSKTRVYAFHHRGKLNKNTHSSVFKKLAEVVWVEHTNPFGPHLSKVLRYHSGKLPHKKTAQSGVIQAGRFWSTPSAYSFTYPSPTTANGYHS